MIDVVDEKKHSDDEKSDDDGDKGDRTDAAPSIPGFSQYLYFLFGLISEKSFSVFAYSYRNTSGRFGRIIN